MFFTPTMRLKSTYSEFTECPECHAGVHFGRLVFGREFGCPHCGKEIRISPRYTRNLELISCILGLLIPYLLGAKSWFLLLWWVPCALAVLFVLAWTGMPFLPPKLERAVLEPPSVLGLGPK